MTANTHAETANGGARRRPRVFTNQLTVYVPAEFDEAFTRLGSSGVLGKSDHLRLALQAYLQMYRLIPTQDPHNG